MNSKVLILFSVVFTSLATNVFAQNLEQRMDNMESYVQTLEPSINEFSVDLQRKLSGFTNELQANVNRFTQDLDMRVDDRFIELDYRTVYLKPVAGGYQRIDTNTGTFLIGIKNIEQMKKGYRLALNIGNPNFANYSNFKIRIQWGKKWSANSNVDYNQWRASLRSAEFTYRGTLERGTWNSVDVDLVPADKSNIAHIECQMEVNSIDLIQR